ncbi:MAG: NAD-dependent epimerase/dehydratase family protein [Promethearchaeota archaeon]
MNILVTGGLGTIGQALVKELRKRGFNVWLCDKYHHHDSNYIKCDVGEYRQVEQLFKKESFDLVYHLAAEFGRMNGEHFYETLWKSNVIGTKNIVSLQEKKKFKLIFSSSSEIYGDYQDTMTEDVPLKYPIRQLNDYAITKWVNEQQIMNSEELHNTETVRIRLFNTYGPGEYYSNYRSVICLFIYRALHNMPYTVFLNHHRSSTYIDDTIRTISNLTDKFHPGEVYNISGDEYHNIETLSKMILEYLDKDDSLVEYINEDFHNVHNKKADNSKAKKDLGHKISMTLKEGIQKTIDWQKKIYITKA